MRVKTEDRRQAIMRAALEVFGKVGYDRASMTEIAARLGYSKATIYSYFPSKEELFATALLEAHSDEADRFLNKLDPARDDIAAVLEEFGRAYLIFNSSPRLLDHKRNSLAQGAASPLGPLLYERGPRQSAEKVQAYLEGLMRRGILRRSDPEMAALHLQGLLEAGVVEPCLFGAPPRIAIDQAAPLAVEIFMRAYAASPVQT